mmetsp:Transcript_10332/g.33069  ORF Transcript_10332/g.33069 Transcript_10332/m.33069 type:complete len:119 (+) Transcript_10332:74-430(+)
MGSKDYVSIRARDKTTGKDLILRVPKNASMQEVMEEYTRKFNEQEGRSMSTEEFRFVSNGQTVERDTSIEDLPTGAADHDQIGSKKLPTAKSTDEYGFDVGCGAMGCSASESNECAVM